MGFKIFKLTYLKYDKKCSFNLYKQNNNNLELSSLNCIFIK